MTRVLCRPEKPTVELHPSPLLLMRIITFYYLEMGSKELNQDKIDKRELMRQMTQLITMTITLYSTNNLYQNDLKAFI